jgi:T5SS/PEP-CTERM-associated repeat protein
MQPFQTSQLRNLYWNCARFAITFAACFMCAAERLCAQEPDTVWNVAAGSWFDDANWTNGVPTSTEYTAIDNGGTSRVQTHGAEAYHLSVGYRNTGDLRVEAGGTLLNTGANIGGLFAGEGAATVDGDGSVWSVRVLSVGYTGLGTLTISNGGNVYSENLTRIGFEENSRGSILVTGDGSEWIGEFRHNMDIGYWGKGELRIESGGHVTSGDVRIAWADGSEGSTIVTGQNSRWIFRELDLARSGTGTLTISDGAVVSCRSIKNWASEGRIAVNDPGSKLELEFLLELDGGMLSIQNGGRVTVGYATWIDEGIVYLEDGTITSNLLNIFRGELRGSGTAEGNVTNSGVVAPGTSVGTLNIHGTYSQLGDLQIELASPTSFDTLAIDGAATLDGTLEASLLDGFVPILGDAFDVLTATEGIAGTFSNYVLPALPEDLVWIVNYNGTAVRLEVAPDLAGDYNGDGVVGAADYAVWRDGLGGEFEQADFNTWAAKFGAVMVSGGAGSTSVPEPAAWRLVMVSLVAGALMVRSASPRNVRN